MDPHRLRAAVTAFDSSADGRTFVYTVEIGYGVYEWTLLRRFSEFYQLQHELFSDGYAWLPLLPPKTLVRPNQPEIAAERQAKLHEWLLRVLVRPDLRLARPTINWLEFEENVGVSVADIKLQSSLHTPDQRFSTTDFAYLPEQSLLVLAQADRSSFSKLGKAWNVLDMECCGQFLVYAFGPSDDPEDLFDPLLKSQRLSARNLPVRLVPLCRQETAQRLDKCVVLQPPEAHPTILLASEKGDLLVFTIQGSDGSLFPHFERRLEVHIQAPFIELQRNSNSIASLGDDYAIRVFSNPTLASNYDLTLLSGGRIVRPLLPGEGLTASYMVESAKVALIGTSLGRILIYSVASHPPQWLKTLELGTMTVETSPGKSNKVDTKPLPVTCLTVSPYSSSHIFVAAANRILIFDQDVTSEQMTPLPVSLRGEIELSRLAVIRSMVVVRHGDMTYLIVGTARVLSIWRVADCKLMQAVEVYSWGEIHKVQVLTLPVSFSVLNSQPSEVADHILVATSNRGVQILPLPNLSQWTSWPAGDAALAALALPIKHLQDTRISLGESPILPDCSTAPSHDDLSQADDSLIEAFGPAVF